jgi:hypothetical protein
LRRNSRRRNYSQYLTDYVKLPGTQMGFVTSAIGFLGQVFLPGLSDVIGRKPVGLLFGWLITRCVLARDAEYAAVDVRAPGSARAYAAVSLLCWTVAIISGRLLAYYTYATSVAAVAAGFAPTCRSCHS